jgi:hypothetical protein
MNNFSTQCESKLAKLHARLDTIDTTITLLETKVRKKKQLQEIVKLNKSFIYRCFLAIVKFSGQIERFET